MVQVPAAFVFTTLATLAIHAHAPDYSQFELVREALAERAHLLHAAPYMAHAMPIMIPTYSWLELPYMWLGAKMYDLIAGSKRVLPASRYLSKVRCLPGAV